MARRRCEDLSGPFDDSPALDGSSDSGIRAIQSLYVDICTRSVISWDRCRRIEIHTRLPSSQTPFDSLSSTTVTYRCSSTCSPSTPMKPGTYAGTGEKEKRIVHFAIPNFKSIQQCIDTTRDQTTPDRLSNPRSEQPKVIQKLLIVTNAKKGPAERQSSSVSVPSSLYCSGTTTGV